MEHPAFAPVPANQLLMDAEIWWCLSTDEEEVQQIGGVGDIPSFITVGIAAEEGAGSFRFDYLRFYQPDLK